MNFVQEQLNSQSLNAWQTKNYSCSEDSSHVIFTHFCFEVKTPSGQTEVKTLLASGENTRKKTTIPHQCLKVRTTEKHSWQIARKKP